MPLRLALLALALLAVSPAPAGAYVVGLADQNAATWSDARATALGLRYARLVTPYDAATTEPARVQAWLDAVRAAGAEPHVAFEHPRSTRCPSFPCAAPTAAQYAAAVRAFVARFPSVRTYTTWNEANHQSQPVADRPELVARYYEELRATCAGCTVVAGDVLDSGAYVSWLRRFRGATSSSPQLWGLHNYGDATYQRTTATDAVLAEVPGQLWLEETGGIVTLRTTAGRVTLASNETRAAAAVRQAFAIARGRPRIGRLYVYHWKAGARDRFDAGLVRPDGALRPSYTALLEQLRDGVTPAAAGAPPKPMRWSAVWSARKGVRTLVVRGTCRTADRRCRGNVRASLQTRGRGTSRVLARALGSRTYRTSAGKRTFSARLRVSAKLVARARRARQRTVVLVVRPTFPSGSRATVRVRVKVPPKR